VQLTLSSSQEFRYQEEPKPGERRSRRHEAHYIWCFDVPRRRASADESTLRKSGKFIPGFESKYYIVMVV
jgi:hypothetical protein